MKIDFFYINKQISMKINNVHFAIGKEVEGGFFFAAQFCQTTGLVASNFKVVISQVGKKIATGLFSLSDHFRCGFLYRLIVLFLLHSLN